MTLKIAQCVVKVGNNLYEPFEAKRGFRQGGSLSSDFFNILMERIICAAGLRHSGKIVYKTFMPLSDREVAVAFAKFAQEAWSIGLAVNESKTNHLLYTAKDTSIVESVEIDFEVVKDFVCLGSSINTDNDISLEIRRRITLANSCYFGLRK